MKLLRYFSGDSSLYSSSLSAATDAGTLNGTSAAVIITEIQRGSDLGGTFSLAFGGSMSDSISYNAPAYKVKSSIQSLPNIERVEVSREDYYYHIDDSFPSTNLRGSRYLITFIDPPGDVQLLRVYADNLSGSAASAASAR